MTENFIRIPRLLEWLREEIDEAETAWNETGRYSYTEVDAQGFIKPEGLPSELADIVMIVVDIAAGLEIDLDVAIEHKFLYDQIRKYKRDAEGNK